jgi:hypothetical protein
MNDAPTPAVKAKPFAWSYSQLNNFETCPRRYQAYSVTREVVEPESENIRYGKTVHVAFEARVAFGEKLPLGMGMYEPMLASLASAPGQVHAERKLAIDRNFQPAPWFAPATWFRQVLDYTNLRDDGVAVTVDYKTGKPKEDVTQLQLAAATIFAHDPDVQRVRAALLFVGYEQTERADFGREQLGEIWGEILPRVNALERARTENAFPPRPGGLCRRYCGVKSCPFNGK